MGAWQAVRRRYSTGSDRGMSLMELVVGMVVMTIAMAIFTAAAVMMYDSVSKSEAVANTSSELSIAFNRLDKSVRYAAAIVPPTEVGGVWYVAWQTKNTGDRVCTQVRLDPGVGQLQQRTWGFDSGGDPTAPTDWLPLASGLTLPEDAGGNPTAPFVFTEPAGAMTHQQLTFHLVAESVGRSGTTKSPFDITFTAANSRLDTPTTGICEG